VGAPPDLLAHQGQDWGLGALSPRALREQGFAPWLSMLRANMAHSGGIRIDHVLGLRRLWLVPEGAPSSAGAYLHFPLQDLLRLTALESLRHQAIVIGEDLGTVPPGFSQQLAEAGVLGIRALWFQREGQAFLPPRAWPASAMATTSTHDLCTVAGWWAGRDIERREALGLLGPQAGAADGARDRTQGRQSCVAGRAARDARRGIADGAAEGRRWARCWPTSAARRRRWCWRRLRTCSASSSSRTCRAPSRATRTGASACPGRGRTA
jgi:4-alpha-glucanotransferase